MKFMTCIFILISIFMNSLINTFNYVRMKNKMPFLIDVFVANITKICQLNLSCIDTRFETLLFLILCKTIFTEICLVFNVRLCDMLHIWIDIISSNSFFLYSILLIFRLIWIWRFWSKYLWIIYNND